jgi:hypothetical protein
MITMSAYGSVLCPCSPHGSVEVKLYQGVTSTCACGRAYHLHACPNCGCARRCAYDCSLLRARVAGAATPPTPAG